MRHRRRHAAPGQGLAGLALIIALMALVAFGALTLVGGRVSATLSSVGSLIGGAAASASPSAPPGLCTLTYQPASSLASASGDLSCPGLFAPSSSVTIYLLPAAVGLVASGVLTTVSAAGDGTLSASLVIPSDIPPGTYSFEADGLTAGSVPLAEASPSFTVTGSAPSGAATTPAGSSGTSLVAVNSCTSTYLRDAASLNSNGILVTPGTQYTVYSTPVSGAAWPQPSIYSCDGAGSSWLQVASGPSTGKYVYSGAVHTVSVVGALETGPFSGSSAWHNLAQVNATGSANNIVSGSYTASVSSNCSGQYKNFYWQVVDSEGTVHAAGGPLVGSADTTSGNSDSFSGSFAATLASTSDRYVLQVLVTSSCVFYSASSSVAVGSPLVVSAGAPDIGGWVVPLPGSGAWNTIAAGGGIGLAGDIVSGTYNGTVSSNCYGQNKIFDWRVIDPAGRIVSEGGPVQVGADTSAGTSQAVSGSFTAVQPVARSWYAVQTRVSSSCAIDTTGETLSVAAAGAGAIGAAILTPLTGMPVVPNTPDSYAAGGNTWQVIQKGYAAGTTGGPATGTFNTWVSSNCGGQVKMLSWRVRNAAGSVVATGGPTQLLQDDVSGYFINLVLSFPASMNGPSDWYGFEVAISSSCPVQSLLSRLSFTSP